MSDFSDFIGAVSRHSYMNYSLNSFKRVLYRGLYRELL